MEESDRIKGLQKGDRHSQKWLYDRYAPTLFAICLRYAPTREDAEDLLIETLMRIIDKAGQYSGEGSFEGWIRRIAVRECLMFLRKKRQPTVELKPSITAEDYRVTADEKLQHDELLALIRQLPEGYRTIFQLYEIEVYKHREIGELLGISLNTSKSQLINAKRKLQELINNRER